MSLSLTNPAQKNAKSESAQPALEVLLVEVGGAKLAIRARNVARLQNYTPDLLFHPGDDAPAFLLGLLGWRGTYLPLLDLNNLLQQPALPADQTGQQVVVIEWQGHTVGFLVQMAHQIERILVKDVRLLPPIVEKSRIKPVVWAVWQPQPDEIIPLIDPAEALDEAEWQAVEQHGILLYQHDNLNGL